jgi:hypothetical protein
MLLGIIVGILICIAGLYLISRKLLLIIWPGE